MFSVSTVILGLSLFKLDIAAFPTTDVNDATIEARATLSMADTINSYIDLIVASGFKPNGAVHKREDSGSDLSALEGRATATPNINLILTLLKQYGFQPISTTAKKITRDEIPDDVGSALEKRVIPDINLVVSLLKQRGFYPTGKRTTRSLETRQTQNEVETVINQLMAVGYQASDFSGTGQSVVKAITMPVSTTALCPKDNNTLYTTGGQQYQVNCGWDYKGTELPASQVNSLADCLAGCSKVQNCVAANWAPSTRWCYPKSAINRQILDWRYTTAKNVKVSL